jgi:hypothetical protein
MLKNTLKLLIIITIAFTAGFLFNSYNTKETKNKGVKSLNNTPVKKQALAYKTKLDKNLDDKVKNTYSKIIAEYIQYIKNKPNVKFSEFISKRRNTLVQAGEYKLSDPKIEEQVVELYNRINRTNDSSIYDLNSYHIFGKILPPKDIASLCELGDKKSLNISVSVYLNEADKELEPVILNNSILPEFPLDQAFVECETGIFELAFTLANKAGEEAPPIYIIARAWDASNLETNSYLAKGINKETYGVPPSLLAKRKTNEPLLIRMKEQNTRFRESNINIKVKKDDLVSLYGLDNIASDLMKDFKAIRTTIAGADGWARLKPVPIGSNLYISVKNNKKEKLRFVLPVLSQTIDIDLQKYLTDRAVIIIPPSNIKYGDLLLFSKTGKNKSQHSFSFDNKQAIKVKRMEPVETFLELLSEGKSLGLMPLDIVPQTSSIFEPIQKNINILNGNVKIINSIKNEDIEGCNNCTIKIKYTDKISTTDINGNFIINNINIIDNKIEFEIDFKDLSLIYQTPISKDFDISSISLKVPNKSLLNSWNKLIPSLPNNSSIYGDYNHTGFRAFIVGINNNIYREASYFDDKTGMPNKTIYSTAFDPSKISYGKFVFMDIPSGNYVLYILTESKIINSRIVKVKSNAITIVN